MGYDVSDYEKLAQLLVLNLERASKQNVENEYCYVEMEYVSMLEKSPYMKKLFLAMLLLSLFLPACQAKDTEQQNEDVTPSQTIESNGLIPWLSPTEVIVKLQDRGFGCSVESSKDYFVTICTKSTDTYRADVFIYGRDMISVDLIASGFIPNTIPDLELASSFLGFFATLPQEGAIQQEAQNWVENTLPTLGEDGYAEADFMGVRYQLTAKPNLYSLGMGELP